MQLKAGHKHSMRTSPTCTTKYTCTHASAPTHLFIYLYTYHDLVHIHTCIPTDAHERACIQIHRHAYTDTYLYTNVISSQMSYILYMGNTYIIHTIKTHTHTRSIRSLNMPCHVRSGCKREVHVQMFDV